MRAVRGRYKYPFASTNKINYPSSEKERAAAGGLQAECQRLRKEPPPPEHSKTPRINFRRGYVIIFVKRKESLYLTRRYVAPITARAMLSKVFFLLGRERFSVFTSELPTQDDQCDGRTDATFIASCWYFRCKEGVSLPNRKVCCTNNSTRNVK